VIGDGLAAEEQLITSSLSFAADGMAVTVAGEATSLPESSAGRSTH